MPSQAQPLISMLLRTIVLAAVTTLLTTSVALPMPAQNSAPPTARQAATMPQFASRLAHPAASQRNPRARQGSRSGPPQNGVIYDNGPINGTTDAWTINSGFVVSDTLTIPNGGSSVSAMNFGAWLFPGDVLESVQISITSSEFGGTAFFNGVVNFTQSGCRNNQYGFNVCTESSTSSFGSVNLAAGSYWVNLQNAIVDSGNPVYWDENSGVGCDSPGCPSSASQNAVGTIPAEAFSILGAGTSCLRPVEEPTSAAKAVTVPPSPTQSYRVIYNFTGAGDGGYPQDLVIDAAGDLYGATSGGGPFGQGTVFKLATVAGWQFNRLYSFSGVNDNFFNGNLALGADGRLFDTTYFGGMGDGVLFSLSPPGNVLPSVFSNWMETLLYDFTGGSDGANPEGSIVVDSSGNIYGNSSTRGANGYGTLYEFTNSGIQFLHAFPAFGGDGITPIGVVSGSNGLYGLTSGGGVFDTGTLYTTAGGYQVLHSFGPYQISGGPTSLAAGQAGNLFGTDSFQSCFGFGGANVSQFSPPGWNPVTLVSFTPSEISSWVSTDASGNVYGTTDFGGQYSKGNAFKLTCCWNYTDLHDFSGGPNDGFEPVASPVVDAQGNIYGTTTSGGAYGYGVVWEISP